MRRTEVKDYRNEHGELWVNVGSGRLPLDQFVNLDNSPFLRVEPAYPLLRHVLPERYREPLAFFRGERETKVIVRHDCRKPIPFRPNSVDHVLCSHMLDQMVQPDAERVLDGIFRALRPGGTAHVVFADLHLLVDPYVAGDIDADQMQRDLFLHPERGESLKVRVLELGGGFGLLHRWLYDRATGEAKVRGAGFKIATDAIDHPTASFRQGDGCSLHVLGIKP